MRIPLLPTGVTLVAVTKNRSAAQIQKAFKAGIRHLGENRWQEAKTKLQDFPPSMTRHFIGRLQTNKVRQVVAAFDVIQSVDRWELAQKIEKACERLKKTMPVFIQVNTSGEPLKGGVSPEKTIGLVRQIAALPFLEIQGLMTVAVESSNETRVRACFKTLKRLFEEIAQANIPRVTLHWLSMGMSEDYPMAIEEGANMVRLGRAVFD